MLWVFRSCFVELAILLLFSGAGAQQTVSTFATAPVPPAIHAAKKVFISNAGSDSGLFPHPFSGGPDRTYNQFYAELKSWGHYEIVSNPQDADLILELQLTSPLGPADANKQKGASDPWPMFRLLLYDQKSHYILWALTETIQPAILQKTHDHNFDDSLTALIADLKELSSAASSPAP
jgi:hypothetical protein